MPRHLTQYAGLRPPLIGKIVENRAAAELTLQGYRVFMAFDPSESCDLVVLHDLRAVRIEVRAGSRVENNADLVMALRYGIWRYRVSKTGEYYPTFALALEEISWNNLLPN